MNDSNSKVDFFFKIGGSLFRQPDDRLHQLVKVLERLSRTSNIVVTTGSLNLPGLLKGAMGHIVRDGSAMHETNKILLRDCVANYLSELSDLFESVFSITDTYKSISRGRIPVLQQSILMSFLWPVDIGEMMTSDSTSCYFAGLLNTKSYIVLTDVYGIYQDWQALQIPPDSNLIKYLTTRELSSLGSTCVDSELAKMQARFNLDCWILNGFDIDNLEKFLGGNRSSSKFTFIKHEHENINAYNFESIIKYIENDYLDYHIVCAYDDSDSTEPKNIRTVKRKAFDIFLYNREEWAERSSIDQKGWENKLAFTISNLLERLGGAVFTNIIQIDFFMSVLADQVIEDWLLCYDWAMKYRMVSESRFNSSPIKRRYAEWIALRSYFHYRRTFPDMEVLHYYKEMYKDDQSISERFDCLCIECKI